MTSEPMMPRGRSRFGFLVSSAAVATMSKPMKAKKTIGGAGEDAAHAERARREAEQRLDERGGQPAAGLAGLRPAG